MTRELPSAATWNLLDHLTEGVIIAEAGGLVLYSNETARGLLGLDPQGNSLAEVYRHLSANGSRHSEVPDLHESRIVWRDGRPLTVRAFPQQGSGGDLVQVLITAGDPLASDPGLLGAQRAAHADRPGHQLPDFGAKLRLIVETVHRSGWKRVFVALEDESPFSTRLFAVDGARGEHLPGFSEFPPGWIWQVLSEQDEPASMEAGSSYLLSQEDRQLKWYSTGAKGGGSEAPGAASLCRPGDMFGIPLFDRQQRRLGWLCVAEPEDGRAPGSEALSFLRFQAQFAALEIESARLTGETMRRNQQLENLLVASRKISGELEKESVLALLTDQMLEATGAMACTIFEWDKEKGTLLVLQDLVAVPGQNVTPAGTLYPLEGIQPLKTLLMEGGVQFVQLAAGELAGGLRGRPRLAGKETTTLTYIPIRFSEDTFGLIEIVTESANAPETGMVALLVALADQAGTALETALMFEDTVEREQFYNALGRVSLAMNFALSKEGVLDLIVRESYRIFDVEGAYIWQFEGERLVGVAAAGLGEEVFAGTMVPVDSGAAFVKTIADLGESIYFNRLGPEEQAQLFLPGQDSALAVLGVPIEQEGAVSGVLVLVDQSDPDRFGEKDLTRASVFGAQAAIALRNAGLFEELRRFNDELDRRVAERTRALNEESNRVKILLRITSELSASLDQDHVINQALNLVKEAVEATEGVILLINSETDELDFRAALGRDEGPVPRVVPSGLKRDTGLAGWMIENRSAVVVEDTRLDPRWVDLPRSRALRSVLGVPLITSEEVIGVLMLFHTDTGAFTAQQMDLVEAAAIQVANAINNANLYLLIRDQAESLGKVLLAEQIEAAKSQSILESIADGVVVADAESRIILANMAASSILDLSREGVIGKSVNELLGLYGQAGKSWMTTISDWAANADRIEKGTFLSDELAIEEKVVSVHLSPVLAGRQYFGTVSVFRDITQNVELDRLKSEFVSTVSHELRTPMTSIKGYAELMLMGAAGQMTDTQRRYLQVISNNAERLHMLVNDLLDISRMETGKTELDLRPTHVARLVEQVVEGHLRGRIQHEKKHIAVHVDMAPALPLVNADQVRFTQILTNLLDNAFNYTPEHGGIRIHARALDGFVQIGVTDNGIGIPKEIQSKIYDRFFRAEDASVQQVPGTGLGLSIVRSLVAIHGGHLELESAPGKGSSFNFTLPVVVDDSETT